MRRKTAGILFLVLFTLSSTLSADDLDQKRHKEEKQEHADKNYFIVGVLPNSSGNVDGHIGMRLNYSPRSFTRITLETTSLKETDDAFSASPLGLNAILNQEFHLNADVDLLGFRLGHYSMNTNGRRVSLALIPFAGYTFSMVERRESYIFTDLTAVLNREYMLHLLQGFGKLQFTWANPKKYFFRFYGAAGLFFGHMDQGNTIYWKESGSEIQDSYTAKQNLSAFGWRAGAEIFINLGFLSLRLNGDYLSSTGDMKYIYFNMTTGTNNVGEDPFEYISWSARAEITLNFIKMGKSSPSVFYSLNRQGLRIKKSGEWVDLTSDDTKTELVHKFGLMMRY